MRVELRYRLGCTMSVYVNDASTEMPSMHIIRVRCICNMQCREKERSTEAGAHYRMHT